MSLKGEKSLSLSQRPKIDMNTKRAQRQAQGVLQEVLPYKKKKNSGVFATAGSHNDFGLSIKHKQAKAQAFFISRMAKSEHDLLKNIKKS